MTDARDYLLEIEALKRDTAVMIASQGRSVALVRPGTYVRTPEGGQRLSGGPAVQTAARRVVQSVVADARHYQTDMGERNECDAVMVGLHTDDIREQDEFTLDGRRYRVDWVHTDKRYEVRARCRLVS